MLSYLRAVNPGGGTKTHAVPKRIDEYEDNTCVVGRPVYVVGVDKWQGAVDLRSFVSIKNQLRSSSLAQLLVIERGL